MPEARRCFDFAQHERLPDHVNLAKNYVIPAKAGICRDRSTPVAKGPSLRWGDVNYQMVIEAGARRARRTALRPPRLCANQYAIFARDHRAAPFRAPPGARNQKAAVIEKTTVGSVIDAPPSTCPLERFGRR
ncbi:hypothetical protein GCM10011380_27980 [Sphingomonas metalli]|uniref:Uncharacterized protein n=1 Tax=Sphingomonas metalli TaxID=1779358 RepID=A0A916T9V8_9SPHN|nr:hypothetical protein GCM10011380_27980 [Sphingomonas metalli]